MSWLNIFKKEPKSYTTTAEEEFYRKKQEIISRFSIEARFGSNTLAFPVDFEVGEHWTLLEQHSNGVVQFRAFSNDAKEAINGVECHTKSAQNWWEKGASIDTHFHPDADEYIYLVHGILEVIIEQEDGTKVEQVYTSDREQPILIPVNRPHFVKALTEASFVVKFVFK